MSNDLMMNKALGIARELVEDFRFLHSGMFLYNCMDLILDDDVMQSSPSKNYYETRKNRPYTIEALSMAWECNKRMEGLLRRKNDKENKVEQIPNSSFPP